MMPRNNMNAAGACHGYGRILHIKSKVLDKICHDTLAFFKVSEYHGQAERSYCIEWRIN